MAEWVKQINGLIGEKVKWVFLLVTFFQIFWIVSCRALITH